jgi:acyl carrier protein
MDKLNDYKEIFTVVSGIIKRITGNPDLLVDHISTAKDINNWDSLHHVMIIHEIENHFDIQFDLMEMLDITTVEDMCNAISRKKRIA